ncbi:MAG: protein-disulfide reductase DsbD domain-containing protein, partial [Verrucomicrobiota bacterium]
WFPFMATAGINTQGGLIEMEMVSEVRSVQPGKTFTVGLKIWHAPGWHTYWRQPGIVGVPTSLEWTVPDGFQVGEIRWPSPERTKMATLTAWGYEREVLLLVDITPPDQLEPGADLAFSAKGSWMACAKTCHPGFGDFKLSLPVNASNQPDWNPDLRDRFAQARAELPRPLRGWKASVAAGKSKEVHLTLSNAGGEPLLESAEFYFYSFDEQVHSDMPQLTIRNPDGSITIQLQKPEFAPKNPEEIRGVIYNSAGWDAKPGGQFAEVAASW